MTLNAFSNCSTLSSTSKDQDRIWYVSAFFACILSGATMSQHIWKLDGWGQIYIINLIFGNYAKSIFFGPTALHSCILRGVVALLLFFLSFWAVGTQVSGLFIGTHCFCGETVLVGNFSAWVSICLTSLMILSLAYPSGFFFISLSSAIWLAKSMSLTDIIKNMCQKLSTALLNVQHFFLIQSSVTFTCFLYSLSHLARSEATLSHRSHGTEMGILSQREIITSWTAASEACSAWSSKVCRKEMVANTPVRLQMMVGFVKWPWNWQWKVRRFLNCCFSDYSLSKRARYAEQSG